MPLAIHFSCLNTCPRGRSSRIRHCNSCNDSMLEGWPSLDPHNFSQFKPNDPSNPSKMTPITYHPTHDRTIPPPDQENKNILLRHFYQQAEDKLRSKRTLSSENPTPERACKVPKASSANDNNT